MLYDMSSIPNPFLSMSLVRKFASLQRGQLSRLLFYIYRNRTVVYLRHFLQTADLLLIQRTNLVSLRMHSAPIIIACSTMKDKQSE